MWTAGNYVKSICMVIQVASDLNCFILLQYMADGGSVLCMIVYISVNVLPSSSRMSTRVSLISMITAESVDDRWSRNSSIPSASSSSVKRATLKLKEVWPLEYTSKVLDKENSVAACDGKWKQNVIKSHKRERNSA